MLPWFVLYPLVASALGAGGAKAMGKDPKKGALLGAGLGLGAGALPILGGAGAGGSAGWSALAGSTKAAGITNAALAGGATPAAASAAGAAAVPTGMNGFGALLGKGAAGLSATNAAGAPVAATAGKAGAGALAKQAAIMTGVGMGASAAMPKYGQTQLLMNPGFMQTPDALAELEQFMKKGRM